METKLGDERVKERKIEMEFKQLTRGRRESREYQILQQTRECIILPDVKAVTQLHVRQLCGSDSLILPIILIFSWFLICHIPLKYGGSLTKHIYKAFVHLKVSYESLTYPVFTFI